MNRSFFISLFTLALALLIAGPVRAQIYVDADAGGAGDGSSWEDAYTSLQDALSEADGGSDDIWIAEGVYYTDEGADVTDGDTTATFTVTGEVSLYGGFEGGESALSDRVPDPLVNKTVLSGDVDQDDNDPDGDGVTSDPADIEGFNANRIVYLDHANGTISGLTFTAADGSRISSYDGAGFRMDGGVAVLSYDRIIGNTAGTGEDNRSGGGARVSNNAAPTLLNVAFLNNVAGAGGGMLMDGGTNSAASLTNVLFAGNQVAPGSNAGLGLGAAVTLTNVTFTDNRAQGDGVAAAVGFGANSAVNNSIFWGNTDDRDSSGIAISEGASPTFQSSIVQNGLPEGAEDGGDNLSMDPMFVAPDTMNYRLSDSSPAIDAGNSDLLPSDEQDLNNNGNTTEPLSLDLGGKPRLTDGNSDGQVMVDMGVYEAPAGAGGGNVQAPTASFEASPETGGAPLEVSFDASASSDPDGSIASYEWNFGDEATATGETVTHTFQNAGNYETELTVTDNDGVSSTATTTIQVAKTLTASFTADPERGAAPLEVRFDASGSSAENGSIASYAWEFGDGASGSGQTVTHTYESAGTYSAQLTVTDDQGKSATDLIYIRAQGEGQVEPPSFSFPDDLEKGYVDATDDAYGAVPDDGNDDTEALQAALAEAVDASDILYIPDGTYIVSERLLCFKTEQPTNCQIQGQSEDGTILKLTDNASGFGDANVPRGVLRTSRPVEEAGNYYSAANAFHNSIYDLTVDVGSGNPGAEGIVWYAHNQGAIRNVTIRGGKIDQSNSGFVGIDLYRTLSGPNTIKDITIEGFAYGIRTAGTIRSFTMLDLTLRGQRRYGIWNDKNVVSIYGLTSDNQVPVIKQPDVPWSNNQTFTGEDQFPFNGKDDPGFYPSGDLTGLNRDTTVREYARSNGSALLTLIDADLSGGAPDAAAIENERGQMFVRDVRVSGYGSAIVDALRDTTVSKLQIDEYASSATASTAQRDTTARASLDLPMTLPNRNGELDDILYSDPSTWINVEDYIDEGEDDATGVQQAIDAAGGDSTTVFFPENLGLENTVEIRGAVEHVYGMQNALVGASPRFRVTGGSADTVIIDQFEGLGTIEHSSDQTLYLRSIEGVEYKNTGAVGTVFLEDVVGTPYEFGSGQQAHAFGYNTEGRHPQTINDGGQLTILGLKTEARGTHILTKGGGSTELLGAFLYTSAGGPERPDQPLFDVQNGRFNGTFATSAQGIPDPQRTLITYTNGGRTANLNLREKYADYVDRAQALDENESYAAAASFLNHIDTSGVNLDYTRDGGSIYSLATAYGQIKVATEPLPGEQSGRFHLSNNYPNPVTEQTTIEYEIARPTQVQLSVYDVLGRKVATLVDRQMRPGRYRSVWNGAGKLASGAYFYRLQAGDYTSSKSLTIIR